MFLFFRLFSFFLLRCNFVTGVDCHTHTDQRAASEILVSLHQLFAARVEASCHAGECASDQYLCAFILCVLLFVIFFLYSKQFLYFIFTRRPYCLFIIVCYRSAVGASIRQFLSREAVVEYYGTAEPPVRCGESHLSGLTEPPHFVY